MVICTRNRNARSTSSKWGKTHGDKSVVHGGCKILSPSVIVLILMICHAPQICAFVYPISLSILSSTLPSQTPNAFLHETHDYSQNEKKNCHQIRKCRVRPTSSRSRFHSIVSFAKPIRQVEPIDSIDALSKDKSSIDVTVEEETQTGTSSQNNSYRNDFDGSSTLKGYQNLIKLPLIRKLFLGIEPSPEIIAIMAIYFVEGALGLARLAQTFLLKDTFHLAPAEMSALTGFFTLPWTVKPIYGFLSDSLPVFGYRRRSYLIICGIIGALCYTALGTEFAGIYATNTDVVGTSPPITMLQATIFSLVVSSGCVAFSDVVADGIVVQRTRDATDANIAGGLQSLCWGSASIGALISAYFSGSLLEVMEPREIFAITAILPAIVACIAFFIDEERSVASENSSKTQVIDGGNESINDTKTATQRIHASVLGSEPISDMGEISGVVSQIESLWQALKQPSVWKPALFLFLWQATPTSDGAFLYFMTDDLGLGPEFLGRARLLTAAASLVGVWGYQKFLRTVSIQKILLWTTIISAPLGLIQLLLISHLNRSLGIPDGAFVFGDDVVLAILGEFAFLPILVLAAKICPPGVEAVLFATLMSIFNGASTVGTEIGALLTNFLGITESNFDNLGLLTIICSLSSLAPLPFIGLLDEIGSKSEAELEEEENTEEILIHADGDIFTP